MSRLLTRGSLRTLSVFDAAISSQYSALTGSVSTKTRRVIHAIQRPHDEAPFSNRRFHVPSTASNFSVSATTVSELPPQTTSSLDGSPSASPLRRFSTSLRDAGAWTNFRRKIGFPPKHRYPKYRMNFAALKLYMCCVELVDYGELFTYLDIPDTFFSYFLLLEIHVWLVLSRIAQDGEDGQFIKRSLIKHMWEDIDSQSKKLSSEGILKNRTESIQELGKQMTAAWFSYDEGALSDDKTLAGAVWRILLQSDPEADPVKISKIVYYIRKQMMHLDHQKTETLLFHGIVTFLPFEGDALRYDASLRDISRVLLGFEEAKKVKFLK